MLCGKPLQYCSTRVPPAYYSTLLVLHKHWGVAISEEVAACRGVTHLGTFQAEEYTPCWTYIQDEAKECHLRGSCFGIATTFQTTTDILSFVAGPFDYCVTDKLTTSPKVCRYLVSHCHHLITFRLV